MYSLVSRHDQPFGSFARFTSAQKVELPDHILLKKADINSGIFKSFSIENGICFLCAAYNPKEDFHLHKLPVAQESFIVRIDDISIPGENVGPYGKPGVGVPAKSQSVSLISSLEEFTFFAPKNSEVRTLEIIIPRRWFFSKLNTEYPYGLMKKYMAIKNKKSQPGDDHDLFKIFFLNIIKEAGKEISDIDFLKKNIGSLLNIFFSDISSNLNNFQETEKVKISKDEINRLINVRKYLDVNSPPPTFDSLTKIALMSSTSLKTKFKKMYGATVFEYYQSMRMQRARILLLTHKYSVKQIGYQLGYSNMSNFTIAFKKEFNQLPHELIK